MFVSALLRLASKDGRQISDILGRAGLAQIGARGNAAAM